MTNAIVVDKNYNGQFSGQMATNLRIQTNEKQFDEIARMYQIGYLRNKVTAKLSSAATITKLKSKQPNK
jgi:hypothetical protein